VPTVGFGEVPIVKNTANKSELDVTWLGFLFWKVDSIVLAVDVLVVERSSLRDLVSRRGWLGGGV